MNASSNEYRRSLLLSAIADGGFVPLMMDAVAQFGPRVVGLVACTRSEPGRGFLRKLMTSRGVPAFMQGELRDALAGSRTIIAFSADEFLELADLADRNVADAVRESLKKPGVIPAVVMGAGAVMTVSTAAPAPDGGLPATLDGCRGPVEFAPMAPSSVSPADLERKRRADRRDRYGMN